MVIIMTLVFAIAALATHRLAGSGARRWLLDHPNKSSLHHRPTTRSGGLAITLGIFLGGIGTGIVTSIPDQLIWIAIASLIVVAVSFQDDLTHVHPAIRITVHLLVALMLVFAGFEIDSVGLPGIQWSLFSWLSESDLS